MQFTIKLRDARTALANRRTVRAAQRQLSEELASFRTTAERAELDDLLSRYSSEETAEIRNILYRHDVHRQLSTSRETAGLGGYLG